MRHWDAYEAFVAVVDRGSYTAAADKLGISKSAVSRFVSDLEERLGSQLLYRTTRKLAPTDLGRLLYERCVGAFEKLEMIELEAMDHDAIPRGRMPGNDRTRGNGSRRDTARANADRRVGQLWGCVGGPACC